MGYLGKLIGAKGLKSCPKCKKSPNLVTLSTTQEKGRGGGGGGEVVFVLEKNENKLKRGLGWPIFYNTGKYFCIDDKQINANLYILTLP